MLMEEIETFVAPSDASFWGGVALGVGGVLLIGAAMC